jgi:hypothetical protein
MSFRNHVGILSFDEIFFPKEPNVEHWLFVSLDSHL